MPEPVLRFTSPSGPVVVRSAEPSLVCSRLARGSRTRTWTAGGRRTGPAAGRCDHLDDVVALLDPHVLLAVAGDLDVGGVDVGASTRTSPEPIST